MIMGSPSQTALAEFQVISDHIGTRDLVQEFLAFKVFPTLREWEMPKLKGEKKKGELVRLPYHYKFKKHFKAPCKEWLTTIEIMCNEILGNYSKKEDQLMTAAFGTRPKRRLNCVLDALNFDYPDYEQLGEDAEGPKRKRIASALDKEGTKLAKKEKKISEKLSPEPKIAAPKKRKAASPKPKTLTREEEAPATPSAAEVEEILKVMTEPLPTRLSPLAPELTKFFQKDKEAAATESPAKPKNEELSKWLMSFIRHRHRRRRQKLSLPKPQPPEPKPPEPKPPEPKLPEPKPPEPKLLEQPLKPKLPEPKPGAPKILI
jgi:hypothetical protein